MNNDTTVNVQINATDTASEVVKNAAGNFGNLWQQIALGEGVLGLVQEGFQLLEQAIIGSIQQAGDFQQQLTMLVTGAGETEANLGIVSNGIKQIAIDTGTTLQQLTQGAYEIESAGFHGADALNILKMAAEGAKADGADLGTVTNALTTIMHDYNIPASQAAQTTDQMIAAVARGKMHMQDFASSLSTVLPMANQVGLSFSQVAGAEATLTAGGVSADQATQDLVSIIRSLIAPTTTQVSAMQQMGLDSVALSKNLGTDGLTGTLKEMFDAITAHMGPDGLVLQSAMKNATLATQDLKTELAALPPQVQTLAQQLLDGSISFAEYRKEARALPEGLGNLAQQFETTYNQAHSFNDQLKAGVNAAPTFAAELKAMTGQTDAMNAVMMLTGDNFATFQSNVQAVGDAAKGSSQNISDWALIQQNFNQKWSEFQALMQVAAVNVGNVLIMLIFGFGRLWNAIQPLLHTIADIFRPALDDLKRSLDHLAVAFNPIWKVIQGPTMEALKGFALLILGPVIVALVALLTAAYVFVEMATWIADAITWVIKFGEGVGKGIGDAINWFNGLQNRVQDALGDAKTWLYQVGRDIMQGMINGVQSMAGAAGNAIKNVGQDAVTSLKGLLGIHSPSTVFAQIGQNMGQGLIQGLQGIQAQANIATTQLVTGSPVLSGPAPASSTVNNYSTSGGNRNSITIQQLVLSKPAAVNKFFDSINQDTLNTSMGLTPVQGAY